MCMHYIKKVRFLLHLCRKKQQQPVFHWSVIPTRLFFFAPRLPHMIMANQPQCSPQMPYVSPHIIPAKHTLHVLCTYIQKYIVHMNLPLGSSLLLGLSEEWSSSTAEFSVTWKMSPISVCEVLPSALFCSWWICSICKCFMVRTWPIRAGLPGLENLQSVQLYALFSSSMEASIFCRWVNRTAAAWCCWFATCTCNLWGLEE